MTSKSAVQRREIIQNQLVQEGSVSSAQLAAAFGVSLMTIYRDLDYLQSIGIAQRESGGAILKQRFFTSSTIKENNPRQQEIKARIGRYAALNLVTGDEGAIIIGGGTTTLEMARALPDFPLNVMANNLEALGILSLHQKTQLYALGGELRKDIMAFGGTMAYSNLKQYHFAKAFIGIDGIDLHAQLTSSNELNARLTELMAAHADEVYLLADLSKFGRKSFRHVLSFKDIDGLVTDAEMPRSYADALRDSNVRIMIAD